MYRAILIWRPERDLLLVIYETCAGPILMVDFTSQCKAIARLRVANAYAVDGLSGNFQPQFVEYHEDTVTISNRR